MKIDAHQHFLRFNCREYGWMRAGMEQLKRDFLPADLFPLLESSGIDGTVAVQARQSVEESRWLLKLSDETPFINAVVGWVDLCSAELADQLENLSQHPRFRGVRHVVHDEPDDRFMMRENFIRGIRELKRFGLTYDLLLFPRHLPVAFELVKRFPEQPFVIDHLAKPEIRNRRLDPWSQDIKRIAKCENTFCKISGMVTEADWNAWYPSDFHPYLEVVLESFGAKRVMVGSDWPVCTLAATYAAVMQTVTEYVGRLSADEQEAIWSGNARRFYGISW